MKIYICDVSDIFSLEEVTSCYSDNEQWKIALSFIDNNRRTKIEKIRNFKDKARSLAAGLLLHYALLEQTGRISANIGYGENSILHCLELIDFLKLNYQNKTGYELKFLECNENEHGKPFLKQYPEIHFNISHSGNYVALIIGRCPCGVDVQESRELSDGFKNRFFHREEIQWLEENSDYYIDIFSMKESVVKCLGKGVSYGFSNFSVVPLFKESSLELEQEGVKLAGKYSRLLAGYALTYVYQK